MSDADIPGEDEVSGPAHLDGGRVIAERYRLESPIGTGGSATIWHATHLALNRPVAVKFVDIVGPRQEQLRERFLREARVAAAIRHRNVVDIVDFGTDDGQPFMVMELLEGRTLASSIVSGTTLSVSEVVRIVGPILSGLGAVHEAGIVHRDLKPENVFLVEDADGFFPKLIDFGVSRVLQSREGLQSVLPTRDDVIVGTPQYMAPEQARGLSDIDHRADLWSAGIMLYELLGGALPFDADAVGDVIIEVATADVPRLDALRPELAGPLAEVVHQALERDREARFQTAAEMRAALLGAVKEVARDVLESSPPGALRPMRRSTPGDSATLSHELDLVDAVLPAARPPTGGRRVSGDVATLAAEEAPSPVVTPATPPPRRWWPAAVVLLLALIAGWAWLGRANEQPAARAAEPPPQVAPTPPPEPVAEPEPVVEAPSPPVPEAEEVAEPEAPRPAPRRRRARLVRDPGF